MRVEVAVSNYGCSRDEGGSMTETLHCWKDGGDPTCMLAEGHDGPHRFTPDNEIMVAMTTACPTCGHDNDQHALDEDGIRFCQVGEGNRGCFIFCGEAK